MPVTTPDRMVGLNWSIGVPGLILCIWASKDVMFLKKITLVVIMIVVSVTTPDHVVDNTWSVLILILTMDKYIPKSSKFSHEFNDGFADDVEQTHQKVKHRYYMKTKIRFVLYPLDELENKGNLTIASTDGFLVF